MAEESVVYGCIRDSVATRDAEQVRCRRQTNRTVLSGLPGADEWPLIAREMFTIPTAGLWLDMPQTEVVAFGSAYHGVEYEWEQWIERFEALLARMFWVSATVHLETALNGVHTFTWDADGLCHEPDMGLLPMRCEWIRESAYL